MKKSIFLTAVVAIVLFASQTYAQSPTDQLFDKYGSNDGFTTVHITKELFALFAEVAEDAEGEDAKEIQEVVQGLDYIRILLYSTGENSDPKVLENFKSELNSVKLKDFTELMTVKEDNEIVKFMIRKDGKIIKELLLILNQSDEAGFISITGDINLKSIAKLSNSMNIKGLENLEKLDEK